MCQYSSPQDLHGVVLAGDGAGPGVAAVLLARHLHVVVGAAVDQSEVRILANQSQLTWRGPPGRSSRK